MGIFFEVYAAPGKHRLLAKLAMRGKGIDSLS